MVVEELGVVVEMIAVASTMMMLGEDEKILIVVSAEKGYVSLANEDVVVILGSVPAVLSLEVRVVVRPVGMIGAHGGGVSLWAAADLRPHEESDNGSHILGVLRLEKPVLGELVLDGLWYSIPECGCEWLNDRTLQKSPVLIIVL